MKEKMREHLNLFKSVSMPGFFGRAFFITFSVTFLLVFIVYNFSEWYSFRVNRALRINQIFNQEKSNLETKVDGEIDYITYRRAEYIDNLKSSLSRSVESAANMATAMWTRYHNVYPEQKVREMILTSLSAFIGPGMKGQLFVNTLGGKSVIFPGHEMDTGKNLTSFHDSLGNYVVRKELKLLREKDSGFLEYYDANNQHLDKIAFVKRVDALGWYIGHRVYPEDFVGEIQKSIVHKLTEQWKNSGDVIFINKFDGTPIIVDGLPYKGEENLLTNAPENKITVFRQELNLVKQNKNGGFFQCSWYNQVRKTSDSIMVFVHSVPEWHWIVGGVAYMSDARKLAEKEDQQLRSKYFKTVVTTLVVLSVFSLIFFFFLNFYYKRFYDDINWFISYFRHPKGRYIQTGKIHFKEIRALGESANTMMTARLRIEDELIFNQRALKHLFNVAPVAMVVVVDEDQIEMANHAFEKLFEFSQQEVIGKSLNSLVCKDASDRISLKDIGKEGNRAGLERELIRYTRTGKKLLVSAIFTLLNSHEGKHQMLHIYRNITDEREREKQLKNALHKAEEADKLKSAFLANMSHEIRTPMNAIFGFTELLGDSDIPSDEQQLYITYIQKSGDTLLHLIDDIIDFSKIEAGQLALTKAPFTVNGALIDLIRLYQKMVADEKGGKVEMRFQPGLPGSFKLNSDVVRVRQILSNLLSNAFKFTSEGHIVVTYEVKGNYVVFKVEDTGIGIAKKNQQLIFERFRQAEPAYNRSFGGAGLGLSICKGLVELLGGEIGVESEYGKGSVFYFTIPLD
jgi:PAS domain S-box-containing protein